MNSNQDRPAGSSTPGRKKNKKLYGLLGGAALAAAVALGGNGVINSANVQAAAPSAANANAYTAGFQPLAQTEMFDMGGKGGRGDFQRGASGTISAISGNTITLKQGDVIVIQATVNASTTYTKAGQTINLGDLKVGQKASVRTSTGSNGTVTVTSVEVMLDQAAGTISAVDAGSLTITRPDNTTLKVNLASSTSYQDLGKTVNLSNLATGMRVQVAGELAADGSLNAEVVNVEHDRLGGTITAINGNTITVQVDGRGGRGRGQFDNGSNPMTPGSATTPDATNAAAATKTITVDSNTVYLEGGQTVQLSNLTVGDKISASGTLSSDGNSLSALQVNVQLPRYGGQVSSVNGSTIVIQDRDGTQRTIEVNANTKYLNGQASATLADVTAGKNINVEGPVDASGKMTASVVQIGQDQGQGHGPKGRGR